MILFLCLTFGLIKLEQVEETGTFLVKIMPVLFIGPCVSLMTIAGDMADQIVPVLAVCLVSTIIVMAVTGLVSQAVLDRKARKEEKSHE